MSIIYDYDDLYESVQELRAGTERLRVTPIDADIMEIAYRMINTTWTDIYRDPPLNNGLADSNAPVNRTIRAYMDIKAIRDRNILLGPREAFMGPPEPFAEWREGGEYDSGVAQGERTVRGG